MATKLELAHADTDQDILACFPALAELRPHLLCAEEMLAQIRRQELQGFRLLAALHDGAVVGVAGYRLMENLLSGRQAYVDDLIVLSTSRSKGVGAALLDEVERYAREAQSTLLVLDTAVTNIKAQRFYFRERLWMQAFRFVRSI